MRIINNAFDKTLVETVNSGVLEHLLEQVNKLQTDLDIFLKELISVKDEAVMPLPEATDLDKVLGKLKLTLKHLISENQKLMELIATIKDDNTKSDFPHPAKAKATSTKLPKPSIL